MAISLGNYPTLTVLPGEAVVMPPMTIFEEFVVVATVDAVSTVRPEAAAAERKAMLSFSSMISVTALGWRKRG